MRSTTSTRQAVMVIARIGAIAHQSRSGKTKSIVVPQLLAPAGQNASWRGYRHLLAHLVERRCGAIKKWLGIDADPQDHQHDRHQDGDLTGTDVGQLDRVLAVAR